MLLLQRLQSCLVCSKAPVQTMLLPRSLPGQLCIAVPQQPADTVSKSVHIELHGSSHLPASYPQDLVSQATMLFS